MRKSLLLLAASLFTFMLAAQDSPMERAITKSMVKVTDEVGDFTITDSDGNSWNLYDELSLGKTVFLDLFFTT
jgi:cytochrome oxidase Cu insertion factor (SCO1/SenC/PrrC family)